MTINSYIVPESGYIPTLTPQFSNVVNSYALVANTAQTVTWPAGANVCNISAIAPYWTNIGATATVPSTNVTDGSASTMSAAQRQRGSGVTFSIISATNQQISIEFWG